MHSLIATTAFLSGGEMFGSLSVASCDAGPWPEVSSRTCACSPPRSPRASPSSTRAAPLAEAIEAGAEAQLAYQQFFGAVGHELRTPLASILGYTEVLLDDAEHGAAGRRRGRRCCATDP